MKYILLFLFLVAGILAKAQFNVVFQPALNGNNMAGLSKASYFNLSNSEIEAVVEITVTCDQQQVLKINLPPYRFKTGINEITTTTLLNAPRIYGISLAGSILKQTGNYAEGEYEFCFNIIPTKDRLNTNQFCFNHSILPATPLLLQDPFDGDIICNERPVFVWQPPIPMALGSLFRFTLVSMDGKQSAENAMSRNIPLIVQRNISSSIFSYPTNLPAVKQNMKYAWQVLVYNSKVEMVTKSEIWEFEVKCDQKLPDSSKISYREIKAVEDGNFHAATDVLNVSLYNSFGTGPLTYKIFNLEKPFEPIQGLPSLKIEAGYNFYSIDLTKNNSFINGKQYLIQVTLKNGEVFKLRFIYTLSNE